MNKRKLHHLVNTIRKVKTWQLLIILFVMLVISATFLRLNNLGMIERRAAVIEADEQGDQEEIQRSIVELQRYVTSHMNTGLGNGVYLQQEYERDRAQALRSAQETTNPNSSVYQQASVECREQFQGGVESFRNDYVQCVINRVAELGEGTDPASGLKLPPVELYLVSFVSPRWSPDLAGFSLLICAIIILVIVGRLLALLVLRSLLKRRYQSI